MSLHIVIIQIFLVSVLYIYVFRHFLLLYNTRYLIEYIKFENPFVNFMGQYVFLDYNSRNVQEDLLRYMKHFVWSGAME